MSRTLKTNRRTTTLARVISMLWPYKPRQKHRDSLSLDLSSNLMTQKAPHTTIEAYGSTKIPAYQGLAIASRFRKGFGYESSMSSMPVRRHARRRFRRQAGPMDTEVRVVRGGTMESSMAAVTSGIRIAIAAIRPHSQPARSWRRPNFRSPYGFSHFISLARLRMASLLYSLVAI